MPCGLKPVCALPSPKAACTTRVCTSIPPSFDLTRSHEPASLQLNTAVIHTILFHRAFGEATSLTVDCKNIDLSYVCSPSRLQQRGPSCGACGSTSRMRHRNGLQSRGKESLCAAGIAAKSVSLGSTL